jgi:hypothetical protein
MVIGVKHGKLHIANLSFISLHIFFSHLVLGKSTRMKIIHKLTLKTKYIISISFGVSRVMYRYSTKT